MCRAIQEGLVRASACRALAMAVSLAAVLLASTARAKVVEEVIHVPVTVKMIDGRQVSRSIIVTVFRDDEREKSPYLVLNHGRSVSASERASVPRQRYSENSRYFVSRGFVVLVPTRVGYGDSGGPDVENAGPCEDRDYAPVFAAVADQTLAVLNRARTLPYVDLSRGLVVGQSFGGLAAIAVSTRNVPGLVAVVNFAGRMVQWFCESWRSG
jgi:dienelactone hydrolase